MGVTRNHETNGPDAKMKHRLKNGDYEYCVLCHKKMDVPRGTPVGKRRHYIEGAGQLCWECWREIYGKEK